MKNSTEKKEIPFNLFKDETIRKPVTFFVLLFGILIAGFMFFAPLHYRLKYHPEISPSDFLPIEIAISFLGGIAVLIGATFVVFGFLQPIVKKFVKGIPLDRGDAGFILDSTLTVLSVIIVFKTIQIYYFNHPEMSEAKWVELEFFSCVAVISFMPFIGVALIGAALNFFWGSKVPLFGAKNPAKGDIEKNKD